MKQRSLTEEEQHLWEHITRQDAPLDARPRQLPEMPSGIRHARAVVAHRHQMDAHLMMPSLPAGYDTSMALVCGAYAGIDRNTAERFRKGDMALDGSIDLHGMSREKAHIALSGFIRGHYERGSRCLLAVTGKGQKYPASQGERKDMQQDGAQGIVRGVLREMFPQWLGEPRLQPMVLAFESAKLKHGGSGAFYILLRRKRSVDGA